MSIHSIERDGIHYYPDGNGNGQLRTDHGDFGTTWRRPLDGDHFTGITAHADYFTAMPSNNAHFWRTFTTLTGAIRYMARHGVDAHGRDLPREASTTEPGAGTRRLRIVR